MREIKKIIWASDGSNESEEALNYAVFFAKNFGSEIIGISVIPMSEQLEYEYFRKSEGKVHNWTVKVNEDIESRLSSIAEELFSHGLNFRGRVLEGEPHKEIVGFARSEKAELIVMGKRGHGLVDRILVGSTTIKVLRESSAPVLAVGKKDEEGSVNIRNILVPVDINEKLDTALKYAIELAQKINAKLSVVYVFRLDTYIAFQIPPNVLAQLIDDSFAFSSTELAKTVEEAKLKLSVRSKGIEKLEINTEVIRGISPSIAIVDYASSKNTDLIVINTHGRKGMKRVILGSVTEKVIQESPCAMLALRP
jgi:nucleotide-binding universal stress UspA family protein